MSGKKQFNKHFYTPQETWKSLVVVIMQDNIAIGLNKCRSMIGNSVTFFNINANHLLVLFIQFISELLEQFPQKKELAVDQNFNGQGIGSGLLKDAWLRIARAAKEIGVRAILVHALDEQARNFYLRHGFYESPTNELTLMVTVEEVQRALSRI